MAATERITVVVCGEKLKQMMGGKGHGGGLGVEVGVGRVGGGGVGAGRGVVRTPLPILTQNQSGGGWFSQFNVWCHFREKDGYRSARMLMGWPGGGGGGGGGRGRDKVNT